MKRYIKFIIISIVFLGCGDSELEKFSDNQSYPISIVTPGGLSGTITKNNNEVTIPIKVTLDIPASRAFEVEIELNNSHIEEQISNGSLQNSVTIPYSDILTPNVVAVEFGDKEAVFTVKITRTILENNYGKTAVFGYILKNPGKGNAVNSGKVGLVQFNISEVLDQDELHYISIFSSSEDRILSAANRRNYNSTAAGLTIPLTATLASFPGKPFTVDVKTNAASVQAMVANGGLPSNTVVLPESEFSFTKRVSFPSNTSRVDFDINVGWNIVSKYVGKKIAICLELTSPSQHILDPTKKTIIATIDPSSVLETDITNLGVLTVSRDHTGGANNAEGSSKLVDNIVTTKFYQANFVGDLWCQLAFTTAQKVGSYTITSANNLPNRDPQEWHLSGSNDGINWTVLDSRGPIVFEQRSQVKRYEVAVPREFRFYRLYITANVADAGFQVAEWRLISIP